jgi:hypothetical protein
LPLLRFRKAFMRRNISNLGFGEVVYDTQHYTPICMQGEALVPLDSKQRLKRTLEYRAFHPSNKET